MTQIQTAVWKPSVKDGNLFAVYQTRQIWEKFLIFFLISAQPLVFRILIYYTNHTEICKKHY